MVLIRQLLLVSLCSALGTSALLPDARELRARAVSPARQASGSGAAAQVPSGSIRGRVHLPGAVAPSGARPGVGDLGPGERPVVERRRSVVYLDAVPRGAFDELPVGRVRMDQRNEQFVPHLLAITVGTIVDFPNSDTKFHNVFSLSKPHPFDLGRYPPGKTGFERFDRPGLIRVFCDIHSHMSGYILVFSHPYFTVTDLDGRYEIPNVPAGTYSLRLWSELGTAEPRRVTVAEGAAAEVDFQAGRAP